MQNDLFNSTYENSLRVLLLMSCLKIGTVDKIAVLDFITIYGKEFDISDYNLHGDNEFSFGEFSLKRKNMPQVLKALVLNGTLNVSSCDTGFTYYINENGKNACNRMNSAYSKEYIELALRTLNKYGSMPENELLNLVTKKSMMQLRR